MDMLSPERAKSILLIPNKLNPRYGSQVIRITIKAKGNEEFIQKIFK